MNKIAKKLVKNPWVWVGAGVTVTVGYLLLKNKITQNKAAQNKITNAENFSYWGIDGCASGWLCIGLNDVGEHCAFVAKDINDASRLMETRLAKIVLIDIPIGFSDNENERPCDKDARKFIGDRYPSVFRIPCRQAIDAYSACKSTIPEKESAAREKENNTTGLNLPKQSWAITPKIVEVDNFKRNLMQHRNENFQLRETHPEVCFRALNGSHLCHSKKDATGKNERRRILATHLPDSARMETDIQRDYPDASKVTDDDILDALVVALVAKIGYPNQYQTWPENPAKDCHGLPMEMVYCEKSND